MDFFASVPAADLALLAGGLVFAGVLTGILAGLFGVGGGAVMVPVLADLFERLGTAQGHEMQLAVGTSLAVIIPTSIRSVRAHHARGTVDVGVLRNWAAPVIVGCVVGAVIASMVRSDAMKAVFACLALLMSLRFLFARAHWRLGDDMPGRLGMSAYGVAIGVISALMGIGGGAYGSLVMTLHNRPIHQAIATSSGLGALIAVPGTIAFMIAGWPHQAAMPPLSIGFVSLIGFALMAPLSTLIAPLGAAIAYRLTKRQLEIGFGSFLALVSAHFFWELLT